MNTSDLQTAGYVTFGVIMFAAWACVAGWIVTLYIEDKHTKAFRRWPVIAWCAFTTVTMFIGVAALEAAERKHRCAYYSTCQESR